MLTAVFAARRSAVAALLPRSAAHPVMVAPGLSALSLTFLDVRTADVAPYRALVVGVPTTHALDALPGLSVLRQMRAGAFALVVHHLLLTTQEARDVARDVFGLESALGRVSFERRTGGFELTVVEGERTVIAMSGELPAASPSRCTLRYLACSQREGRLVETQVLMRAESFCETHGPGHARLAVDRDGLVGAAFGSCLVSSTPLLLTWAPHLQGVVHLPTLLE